MKWMNKLFRVLLLTPIFWWVFQILWGDLGAEPAKELNHSTGLVTLVYLIINLAMGWMISQHLPPWPQVLRFLSRQRRFLGVLTWVLLLGHLFFYFVLEAFQWEAVLQLYQKTYLIFGSFAFLGMTMLALTSNDLSVRKLGGRKWKTLHRSIHALLILVTAHVLLIEKADLLFFAQLLAPLWLLQLLRLGQHLKTRFTKKMKSPLSKESTLEKPVSIKARSKQN